MMFPRLIIISCWALGGLGLGHWLSPSPDARATERRPAGVDVAKHPALADLPPPERAGRVPFLEVYRSLSSSKTGDHIAYLHSLQALPDGPDRRAALTAFFQCLASINPPEAADLVRQVKKEDIERVVFAVLAATSTPFTPTLVKMLLALPPDTDPKWRAEMLNSQMFFWAALDPMAAAQFADQYQNTYPELAANGIIQCLAAADPVAAERWLNEHPDLRKQTEVMSNYLAGLYQGDPANARRYLIEHTTEEAIEPALSNVARLTFLSSADDAVEFVAHLPSKDLRQTALAGILDINTELFANSETSRTDLYAGLTEWVTKFSRDDWPTNISDFLEQWRELDPNGSVNWMAKLPAPSRSAVADELVRHLPTDRLKQILATTAGDFHHDVLTAFAESLSESPDQRNVLIERSTCRRRTRRSSLLSCAEQHGAATRSLRHSAIVDFDQPDARAVVHSGQQRRVETGR